MVYSKSVSCSYISFCLTSTSILFCVVCKYRNKKNIYKSSFGTYFPISGYIRFCYLVTSLCNVKQYFSLEETLRLSLNFKYNFFGKCQLSQKYWDPMDKHTKILEQYRSQFSTIRTKDNFFLWWVKQKHDHWARIH